MLLLMLHLKFKSFYLVSSFVGHEECVIIVEEYDNFFLYFMFLKCYHHLHLVVLFIVIYVKQVIDEDFIYLNRLSTQKKQ